MSPPLADAHLHLFSRGFPGRTGRPVLGRDPEIEAYEAFRAAHGIAAGLVVGYEADGIDPENNRHIRALAAERPWLATLAYVEAAPAPSAEAAAALIQDGHTGLAVYLRDAASAETMAAWPAATWRLLEQHRAIISLNAQPPRIAPLEQAVAAHPDCTFLFSHLGLPGRWPDPPSASDAAERLAPLLRLAPHGNALVKISGLYAVSEPAHAYPHAAAAPFIDLLLDRFGPVRCIWGSDFSPALDFVSFAQAVSVPWLDRLTAKERSGVMGGNLLALLGRAAAGWEGGQA